MSLSDPRRISIDEYAALCAACAKNIPHPTKSIRPRGDPEAQTIVAIDGHRIHIAKGVDTRAGYLALPERYKKSEAREDAELRVVEHAPVPPAWHKIVPQVYGTEIQVRPIRGEKFRQTDLARLSVSGVQVLLNAGERISATIEHFGIGRAGQVALSGRYFAEALTFVSGGRWSQIGHGVSIWVGPKPTSSVVFESCDGLRLAVVMPTRYL